MTSPYWLAWSRPEQAEKLAVKVIPQYAGTSGGAAAITVGRVRVCVMTLKLATGSCRLGAWTLRVGTYQVLAAYGRKPGLQGIGLPQADPHRHPLSTGKPAATRTAEGGGRLVKQHGPDQVAGRGAQHLAA